MKFIFHLYKLDLKWWILLFLLFVLFCLYERCEKEVELQNNILEYVKAYDLHGFCALNVGRKTQTRFHIFLLQVKICWPVRMLINFSLQNHLLKCSTTSCLSSKTSSICIFALCCVCEVFLFFRLLREPWVKVRDYLVCSYEIKICYDLAKNGCY